MDKITRVGIVLNKIEVPRGLDLVIMYPFLHEIYCFICKIVVGIVDKLLPVAGVSVVFWEYLGGLWYVVLIS